MGEKLTFDHYEVLIRDDGSLFELGRGAMGITYKAFDKNLECHVALKVISGAFLNTEGARERFKREARAAAKLRHPNVASVFHLGVEGDSYFYAMEFIDGENVEEFLRRHGPMDPLLALRIASQVARALGAAEKHSLVHRDIKPSNLMLVHEEDEVIVKVIDFGLAKITDQDSAEAALTIAGFAGTPYYASPEQLQEKPLDSRSDIYSLGMTLWFMLTGSAPFTGTLAEVMTQHLMVGLPKEPLSRFPKPIASLLERMVRKDPDERPQSPLELRRELDEAIASLMKQSRVESEDEALMETIADLDQDLLPKVDEALSARYEILDDLGEGESGKNYRARELASGEIVRLIVLNPALIQDSDSFTRLEREVEKLRQVTHPHLLRVLSLEWLQPSALLTVEWTDGFSLLDVLRARREMDPDGALVMLGQAAAGVDYALDLGLDQIDFALHQVYIDFPDLPDDAVREALLRTPVRDWPAFSVKLNPLGVTRELSMSDTWAGGQTIVGQAVGEIPLSDADGGVATRKHYIQALSALVYELLGGSLPPALLRPGAPQPAQRYVPISTLSEEGNAVLRQGLDPDVSFPSARALVEALRGIESFQPRRPATRVPLTRATIPHAGEGEVASTVKIPSVQPPPPTVPPLPASPEKKSKMAPILATAAAVALLMTGVLLWRFFYPAERLAIKRGKSEGPASVATPTASPVVASPTATPVVASPTATPRETPIPALETTPTPRPSPTPKPTPSRQEELKATLAKAESYESEEKWGEAIAAYVQIAQNFPESDLGRVRLEILLQRLRSQTDGFSSLEFEPIRGPLEDAAKLGVTSAMFLFAKNIREENPTLAFDWMSAAANQGSKEAYTQVGLMYSNGAGVARDLSKAVWWFQEAAKRDDSAGLTVLAECYLYGKGVKKDPVEAEELLKRAVGLSDPRAMNLLGTLYHKGAGVPRNFNEARRLFQDAAEIGYPDALGNLGVLYINGDGVRRDIQKAVKLFKEGSEKGSASSMYLYARCLETGVGVTRNRREAAEWYRRAAEKGHPGAQSWCEKNNVEYG